MNFLTRFSGQFVFSVSILAIAVFLHFSCSENDQAQHFSVVNSYPHETDAFTQGLVYKDGFIYEGTGLYGRSSLKKVELKSGKVLKQTDLPQNYFGEGITIFDNKIYQLTWKSGTGFIYDTNGLKETGTFNYSMQGWGITHNGENLIVSDGSSKLYFMDPDNFEINKILIVKTGSGMEVEKLNELEYVEGKIYSNIWQTDNIAVINGETGILEDLIDLSDLRMKLNKEKKFDVLNGIAYNNENGFFYFTGKLWPKLFEVKLKQ